MHAVRQSFRPKHQVLVLKCYPKFQKNVADVKPNSSELSRLLYYASTRRSKVQKVGLFLEKKTQRDVYRGKIGNVQVTLKILQALIEKSSRDLPLFAPYVLSILSSVLSSKDLSMVEESIATFQTFCEHQNVASLAADQEQTRHYEEIVQSYASFAGKVPFQLKGPMSAPIAVRWKSAGLQAIRSICSSEAIGADGGRQMNIVMPAILQNLYSDEPDHLEELHRREHASQKTEKDYAVRRRMSVATVGTSDTNPETNVATISATTADADRLAEEAVGLLALQSLKQIFVFNNRARIRLATSALLRFITSQVPHRRPESSKSLKSGRVSSWAATLMELVARWAPVQDRFVILVTAMESLVRSPTLEDNLERQLVLAGLVDCLLSSNINMIGLSVMDVLLGLVQHVLLLLQLGGKGSTVLPHHQQIDAIDLFQGGTPAVEEESQEVIEEANASYQVSSPSVNRQELLTRLRKCIGDLATHIYYSDQISDMIIAILLRLKPSPMSGIVTTAESIERPAATAQAISDSANLREDSSTHEFFSFGTARITALNAIKDILTVANTKNAGTGAGAIGRNRVSVQVWEGTQWLLRDDDRRVRRAYVDALLTWLRLEMSRNDLRVMEDRLLASKNNGKVNGKPERAASLNRRAVSSTSQRSKSASAKRSTFLALLNLAIYDNVLENPEQTSDILLLHLLSASLVEKLGVNAVKNGLPMVMRLQDDIHTDSRIKTPEGKVNVGSLVHGYLWILTDRFDFDSTMVGYDIHKEISRRREAGLWLEAVQLPPLPLERIVSASPSSLATAIPLEQIAREPLNRFDALVPLVNQIALSYSNSVATPPTSPPSSPGRVFSMPILSAAGPTAALPSTHELSPLFKDAMLTKWSKEACISATERESVRSSSLHGSRAGTTRSANGFLAANGHTPRDGSPAGLSPNTQINLARQRSKDNSGQQMAGLQVGQSRRQSVAQDTGPTTPISSSDHQPILRVDDLKRVLAGGALAEALSYKKGYAHRAASPLRNSNTAFQDFAQGRSARSRRTSISVGSDSIVDAEGFESASEGDLSRPLPPPQSPPIIDEVQDQFRQQSGHYPYTHSEGGRTSLPQNHQSVIGDSRPLSRDQPRFRPRSSSSASAEDPEANARALKGVPPLSSGGPSDDVPPVPPLPKDIPLRNNMGHLAKMSAARAMSGEPGRLALLSDGTEKNPVQGGSLHEYGGLDSRGDRRTMVQQLLSGIEVGEVGVGKGVGKPPY